jgi:hypothetical protein
MRKQLLTALLALSVSIGCGGSDSPPFTRPLRETSHSLRPLPAEVVVSCRPAVVRATAPPDVSSALAKMARLRLHRQLLRTTPTDCRVMAEVRTSRAPMGWDTVWSCT